MIRLLFIYLFIQINITSLFSQLNPYTDYSEIFEAVQTQQIFKDQKTFVDCKPLFPVDTIINHYTLEKGKKDFDLKYFVATHFNTNLIDTSSVFHHIDLLWDYLSKQPDVQDSLSSLIALPFPYIVPGGRFREVYYWDSYFTMLGLQEAGKIKLMKNMIDNFSFLIDRYGHIPNGNRTYYLSRSQPPFFSLMVDLLAEATHDSIYINYKTALEQEYLFWMHGEEKLTVNNTSYQRVVRMKDRSVLNRYWDNLKEARPESYIEDLATFKSAKNDSSVFRNIRAAAESGWDFSSRWFRDKNTLNTIHTTELIPIDLNCLLYHLEMTLMKVYQLEQEESKALFYKEKADKRKEAIIKYCWDKKTGYFYDYDFILKRKKIQASLAGVYPLFFKLVDNGTADRVLEKIKSNYLTEGGLVTTLYSTGQQWDYPNGWAPLQWIGYKGCKNYHDDKLAHEIAVRWTNLNMHVFFETGKMLEKYNVIDVNAKGGGGEYELQDGFGWTNGVFLKLWNEERKK